MSTYAIGDIQGCYDSLQRLLQHCRFDPASDRLWLVGDLVNRGPCSLEVLRFVKGLGSSAITVLGNHDLYLLMIAENCGRRSRDDTLDAVLNAPDRDELLDWLRRQPLMHVEENYALVHAGLLPDWSVAKALDLAGEVESCLRADPPRYRDFLAHLWGSEPDAWDDTLTGRERCRLIVNAMTRLRFCTPQGRMEFKSKGTLDDAPAGFIPWFSVPNRRSSDYTLVTGHWSALGLRLTPNLLALDSGCLWGGPLSAVRLPDQALFQVSCSPQETQAIQGPGE